MEPRLTGNLKLVFILIILFSKGSSENDLDLNFCGIWRHDKDPLRLIVNLSPGCKEILISANESSLSIDGQITAQCRRSDVIHLKQSVKESHFCLFWEPQLDQLKLQVGTQDFILCRPLSVQGQCCTNLSQGSNQFKAHYGIVNGSVHNDVITAETRTGYSFTGGYVDCKDLCDQANKRLTQGNMTKHPCARSYEVEMKEDFRGYNITSPTTQGPDHSAVTVHIPPALKKAANKTSKVVFTFFKNNSLFQGGLEEARILDDVVEINVQNEVISNLSEPIKIGFHHNAINKTHSRKCVSWDNRTDPLQVNWVVNGCETRQHGANHTECLCNHLTYFAVLVQLEPRPVCHLLALTAITSLGCAVSLISCVALIIFLYRKSKRSKEKSIHIHLGLAVSLALLNLLFFFTGVLANVGGERVCAWVGAALHYAVLSSFSWMGIEVFHTFWLIHMVFRPTPPKPYVSNLVGFGLPAVPVIILVAVGDIYGVTKVLQCEEPSEPYLMCWMNGTDKALLAHYFTTVTVLPILVLSGIVMLFLVYREIRNRDEWRLNRVALASIWGLSVLFGVTWGLNFLNYGPLSEFILFLFCILNSLQGFFLMLRFYMLDWVRKQAGDSALGSSSTGSTRQHMLKAQEKS